MTAYDDAAEVYLASGLWPIPIAGKTIPVEGATGYEGTVTYAKVNAWLDPKRRERAGRRRGYDNIGLRHDLTIAIDVDEGYGDKDGVAELAAFARGHGLPSLPPTWSSTARGDDTGSRQYVYRIPETVRFKTNPCPSVELCCWHHRFTACAPSIHPTIGSEYAWYLPGAEGVPPSWGERTGRFPRLDAFAALPSAWLEAVRGTTAELDKNAPVVALSELLDTFAPGDPDPLVTWRIAKWSNPAEHVGHDEFKNAVISALLLGREGRTGVRQLVELLQRRYTSYLAEARPHLAAGEVRSLLNACTTIAQQKTIEIATKLTDADDAPDANGDEFELFLTSATSYTRAGALGRRTAWMRRDGVTDRHVLALINEAARGYYPAARALLVLRQTYGQPPGTDPTGADLIFARALGAFLNREGVAA